MASLSSPSDLSVSPTQSGPAKVLTTNPKALANKPTLREWFTSLYKGKNSQSWLPNSELKARVARSPSLVKEIYEIAQRQALAETGRQGRLDAKATSLMGSVGLCLTVAFTFGGLVLTQASRFTQKINETSYNVVAACFALAIVFGLGAGAFALKALAVTGSYLSVSEEAVFNKAALDKAEEQEDDDVGLAVYRRFLVVQLWDNVRQNGRIHDRKASYIRLGQICFAMFLVCLFFICVAVVSTIK